MNWSLQTYGEAPEKAFETLCNQLFRRYLARTEGSRIKKFRDVNGFAGDGGVESYGQLDTDDIIAVQSKWFREKLEDVQFRQIEKSITTALALRPQIKRYIVCIPRKLFSLKYVRGKNNEGKKPADHHEDEGADVFFDKVSEQYPGVQFEWWFETDIELELAEPENEGIRKFWFDKEVVTHDYLEMLFSFQRKGWLHDRYIPELHAKGTIKNIVDQLCFNESFKERAMTQVRKFGEAMGRIRSAVDDLIDEMIMTLR